MKSFFKLIVGRFFWFGLIVVLEIFAVVLLIAFSATILNAFVARNQTNVLIAMLVVTIVLDFIAKIFFSVYIINTKVNHQYKITWLIVVNSLIILGMVLYAMFGNKNATKKTAKKLDPIKNSTIYLPLSEEKIEQIKRLDGGDVALDVAKYLQKNSQASFSDETETTFYDSGEDVFPVMLQELQKAEHYIFIQYFIIGPGKFWDPILDILKYKAQHGVDVRVIYDDIGSISLVPSNYPKILQEMGIKCFAYEKFRPFINTKMNNRDHRKMMIIDGYIAFTGGINIADEYINVYQRFGYWKDNAIRIKGKAVYSFTTSFLGVWCSSQGNISEIKEAKYAYNFHTDNRYMSDGYVQHYGDTPYQDESIGETVYIKLIYSATKSVHISTPYFIVSDELLSAIVDAARRGVDVTLLTPGIPDKKLVWQVTRSFYKPLLDAGAKVYEYTPGFNHEKVLIVDDTHATIGSLNFDFRSLYLNLENCLYLFKCECIKEMKESLYNSMAKSKRITPEIYKKMQRKSWLLWAFMKIFAPLM